MAGVSALVVASAVVKEGRLVIHNRKAFDSAVESIRPGTQVEIAVTRLYATRSIKQNRWYWGVCVELLSEHTGYGPEEMHDILKAKFLPKHLAVTNGNGHIVDSFVIGGSTRELNTVEFKQYTERIQQWAAEDLGVVIPDPEPEMAEAF